MKFLINERLSEHKTKTPEGYLICLDAILARTGKQTYKKNEIFVDSDDDTEIEVDRTEDEVFSPQTLASFENKPITVEHPDEDVNVHNYKEYAVGFVRDVRRGEVNGEPVILGNLVITDEQTIQEIENGEHTDLSCGYDCDIVDEEHPCQKNIRGNHVALCEQGRAGIARIVDSVKINDRELVANVLYNAKSGAKLLIKKATPIISEYDGTPDVKIDYTFTSASGSRIGSSTCYAKDFWKMLTDPKLTGDSVKDYYNKFEKETNKEFLKEALNEMRRYERNWSFMSAQEKRNIAPNGGIKELRENISFAEKRLRELHDSINDAEKLTVTELLNAPVGTKVLHNNRKFVKISIGRDLNWKEEGSDNRYSEYALAQTNGGCVKMYDAIKKYAEDKIGRQFVLEEQSDGRIKATNESGREKIFKNWKEAREEFSKRSITIFDDDKFDKATEQAYRALKLGAMNSEAIIQELKRTFSLSYDDAKRAFMKAHMKYEFEDSVEDDLHIAGSGKYKWYVEFINDKGQRKWTYVHADSKEHAERLLANYGFKVVTVSQINDSINDVEPREDESKDEFIARFMKETEGEYPDEKQRLAVAYSYWNKKDSVKDALIDPPQDIINDFERQLKANGVIITATGKTMILGRNHYQVKYYGSGRELNDIFKKIDQYMRSKNIPMTWSIASDTENDICTAGIDLDKMYVKDSSKKMEKVQKIVKAIKKIK